MQTTQSPVSQSALLNVAEVAGPDNFAETRLSHVRRRTNAATDSVGEFGSVEPARLGRLDSFGLSACRTTEAGAAMNMQSTFGFSTLRELGEAGKQVGMQRAADVRAEAVASGQVALLRALLDSTSGTATVDDATDDLSAKFDSGGKWRGSIPAGLARKRIIESVGVAKSDRPSRHRGYVTVWRLRDRVKARTEIERLTAAKNPQSDGNRRGQLESKITNPQSGNGDSENATH